MLFIIIYKELLIQGNSFWISDFISQGMPALQLRDNLLLTSKKRLDKCSKYSNHTNNLKLHENEGNILNIEPCRDIRK